MTEADWAPPSDAVVENYAAIIESRGWTWEQLALTLDEIDKPLADYLRVHGVDAEAEAVLRVDGL